jgi:hypothetical protein
MEATSICISTDWQALCISYKKWLTDGSNPAGNLEHIHSEFMPNTVMRDGAQRWKRTEIVIQNSIEVTMVIQKLFSTLNNNYEDYSESNPHLF